MKPSLVIHPWPLADAAAVARGAARELPELAESRVWLVADQQAALEGAETLSPAELAAHRAADPGILDEALFFFCPGGLSFADLGRMRVVLFHEQLAAVAASRFASGARSGANRWSRLKARLTRKRIGPFGDTGFGALLLAPGLAAQLPELTPRAAMALVATKSWPAEEIGATCL